LPFQTTASASHVRSFVITPRRQVDSPDNPGPGTYCNPYDSKPKAVMVYRKPFMMEAKIRAKLKVKGFEELARVRNQVPGPGAYSTVRTNSPGGSLSRDQSVRCQLTIGVNISPGPQLYMASQASRNLKSCPWLTQPRYSPAKSKRSMNLYEIGSTHIHSPHPQTYQRQQTHAILPQSIPK
jgi:hypothetical protein